MQSLTKNYQSEGLPGQFAQGELETEALSTGFTGQNSRITIGDAAYVATTYTIDQEITDGLSVAFSYDGTADANATAAATGMAAAWNANPSTRQLGLASVAVAKNVDIAWRDYTRAYSPTLGSADAATFTHAVQRAASSRTARFGVMVARGTASGNPRDARPLAVLTSATIAADIRGFVGREDCGVEQTSLEPSANSFDAYPAGRVVPIGNRGRGWVVCETAMTPASTVYVVIDGNGIIGSVRSDADGGNAIDYSAYAKVEVGGAAGKTCKIKINVAL